MDWSELDLGWDPEEYVVVPRRRLRWPATRLEPPPLPATRRDAMTLEVVADCSGWRLTSPEDFAEEEVMDVDECELIDREGAERESVFGGGNDSLVPTAIQNDDEEGADEVRIGDRSLADRRWWYAVSVAAAASVALVVASAGQRYPAWVVSHRAAMSCGALGRLSRAREEPGAIVLPGVVVVVSARDVPSVLDPLTGRGGRFDGEHAVR